MTNDLSTLVPAIGTGILALFVSATLTAVATSMPVCALATAALA